jgi:hypothetical protein
MVGGDLPHLRATDVKSRLVDPRGRHLGLEYHRVESGGERCVGGPVPVFRAA